MNPFNQLKEIAATILRELLGELAPAVTAYLNELVEGWLRGEPVDLAQIRADIARIVDNSATLQSKRRPE